MNYNRNLLEKYKSLMNDFVMYCYEYKFSGPEDYDEEAKAKWQEIESFEIFCKIFFNINIKEAISC